ncbi:hypothetical protein VUR80DRAFT_7476 [Thermomyces stellatus]
MIQGQILAVVEHLGACGTRLRSGGIWASLWRVVTTPAAVASGQGGVPGTKVQSIFGWGGRRGGAVLIRTKYPVLSMDGTRTGPEGRGPKCAQCNHPQLKTGALSTAFNGTLTARLQSQTKTCDAFRLLYSVGPRAGQVYHFCASDCEGPDVTKHGYKRRY